jgi:hypothetical protein
MSLPILAMAEVLAEGLEPTLARFAVEDGAPASMAVSFSVATKVSEAIKAAEPKIRYSTRLWR